MKIGRSILGDYRLGSEREYLITNGLGSFSNGAINGNHSRQYHGLYITSTKAPLDRYMLVHKVEEEIDGIDLAVKKEINANKVEVKEGYKLLSTFDSGPIPKWTYMHKGSIFEKEQFMVSLREILGIKYTIKDTIEDTSKIKLKFYLNYRDIHQMTKKTDDINYLLCFENGFLKVEVKPINKSFYILTNGKVEVNENLEEVEYDFQGKVINKYIDENIAYDIELGERGNDSLDTSVNSFNIISNLKKGDELKVLIVNEDVDLNTLDFDKLYNNEKDRVKGLKEKVDVQDTFVQDLALAADTFIVNRESTEEKTILAGYPWFGDWGRDTMISLPGLTLATGRYKDAESILKTFSKYVDKGMLPNKFPDYDGEELMYNTIDASLWYFFSVYKYLEYTNNYDFVKENILTSLEEVLEYHIKGTRYGIKVDMQDGLLSGGSKETQLTWMDVKYKGWAVTPRYGKCAEINALWYNALKIYEKICQKLDIEYPHLYKEVYSKVEANYRKVFWNGEFLNDYVASESTSSSIRPNQIFTVSLPYKLLKQDEHKSIVDTVYRELYTTKGLRSLEKSKDEYKGLYYGSLYDRDSCYHQGTVWAWLIGHFLEAHYLVYNDREIISLLLEGLKEHFYNEGAINNISEIFDGDEPNLARGCYAQAWSVAEILRIYKEIIFQ